VVCLTHMLGRPVISARTGNRLGRVSHVVVDLTHRRIVGFRLRAGGLFDRRWRLAAMQDVANVSLDAVIVPDDVALREDEWEEGHLPLGGRPAVVVGTDGAQVGRLTDVSAELETGALLDLVVTSSKMRLGETAEPFTVPVEQVSRSNARSVVLEAVRAPRGPNAAHRPA